ncbi:MAG: hypothetical protein AAF217_14430 [Pseudomonadota bacterium]
MNIAIAFFVVAIGFTTAALLYQADYLLRGRAGGFVISGDSLVRLGMSLVYFMFIGPYIVTAKAVGFWRQKEISFMILVFAGCVSLMWSFCSGVFITQAFAVFGLVSI